MHNPRWLDWYHLVNKQHRLRVLLVAASADALAVVSWIATALRQVRREAAQCRTLPWSTVVVAQLLIITFAIRVRHGFPSASVNFPSRNVADRQL
jgi:hypothetical protein